MTIKTLTVNDRKFRVNDSGAVRFDAGQNLTDEEKNRARENIGVDAGMLEVLLACDLVPAVTDGDGAVLTETDGTILINL